MDDASNLDGARASTGTFGEIVYAVIHNDSGLLRRPLANLSFLFNYQVFGGGPYSYKIFNLILHWLNACLVWRLSIYLIRLLYPATSKTARELRALFIASLWAIHPIQVSGVLYVVQRMAEMSAFFVLLGLVFFLRLIQKPVKNPYQDVGLRTIAIGAIVALGILSKENAVLFPCFVLAIYLSAAESERKFLLRDTPSKAFFLIWTWIPLLLGSLILIAGFSWLTAGYASREFTLIDRIFTEPFVLLRYLGTMLFPDIRNMGLYVDDMPMHHSDEPLAWLLLAITVFLPIAAIIIRKRAPALAFCILWFLCAHLLESTILPLEVAFEHRNYLALLGPMFAVGYYLQKLLLAAPVPALRLVTIIPIAILGTGTLVRAHQWSEERLFLEREIENHPFSPRAQNTAIAFDVEAGDLDKAIAGVKRVQALKPGIFWPLSLDFNLACGIPGYPVSWDKMESQINDRPMDITTIGMLRYDANSFLTYNCKQVDIAEFDLFLTHIADIYRAKNLLSKVEEIYVLRSYLAKSLHQSEVVRDLLKSGAEANPEGLIALSDMAYFELNAGNTDSASSAIDEFERRVKRASPTRQFEVDELRQYLSQAKAEQAARH